MSNSQTVGGSLENEIILKSYAQRMYRRFGQSSTRGGYGNLLRSPNYLKIVLIKIYVKI